MRIYNDPANGKPSSIGEQLVKTYYMRKAIEEAAKEQYFSQLADTQTMPKHSGKVIEAYVHIPILDDRNVNDQGIDATGKRIEDGNLYGSSKDVGTITGKMPILSEIGGRVNRVGFTRKVIRGTFQKYGFFSDYTRESVDFDSETDLEEFVNREMVKAANEINEDLIQIDLLNSPGIVKFGGAATSNATVDDTSLVEYEDFARLTVDLDNNRTPKSTKVIKGSRMTDTRTINSGRVMFCGSEAIQHLRKMVDYHGEAAFISVEKYSDGGGEIMNGEVGVIDQFRIVVVPEMMKWAGAGATVADDKGIYTTGGKADIFPMLVVGSESFTTIGFQTSGKSVKFEIIHKKPSSEMANLADPYGERGFMSIKWFYGFMIIRPERIALIKTALHL